jgi:hypothetical protein
MLDKAFFRWYMCSVFDPLNGRIGKFANVAAKITGEGGGGKT